MFIYIFTILLGFCLCFFITWPVFTPYQVLNLGSVKKTAAELQEMMDILVIEFLELEDSLKSGHITSHEFKKRQEFLLNNYIDLAEQKDKT